ncbi:ABC-three component system middle component 2 [Stenotrophomonas maltophilia]|uniref:ABC-three component system middle component 2 n=1 Tax=Stenotrophomonas maltophilia TaxID=40324 RepID=UPI0034E0984D
MSNGPGSLRSLRPFNTPLECGFRTLFLLNATNGAPSDLQRLVSYDYLLVHSGDIPGGPSSLHPAVPLRGTELLVKRDLVRAGLNQMFSRELLMKSFESTGIMYRSTALTTAFVDLLKSDYAKALRHRSEWIVSNFGGRPDGDLDAFMSAHVGKWGAEFERLTAPRDLEL